MESMFFARLDRIGREHAPTDLVENRVTFGAEHAAFSVYDTVRPAERVPLAADNPLYCGMVTGKKVVHTATGAAIPFLPLESLVVPTGQTIEIDFPGASDAAPTKCLTIEIDRARVRTVAARLNETAPRTKESGDWRYDDDAVCHFMNTPGIEHTVRQLVGLFVEDAPDKDVLIDLGVQELVVRMLRVEARRLLLEESERQAARHGLAVTSHDRAADAPVKPEANHVQALIAQRALARCVVGLIRGAIIDDDDDVDVIGDVFERPREEHRLAVSGDHDRDLLVFEHGSCQQG